jgi:hypothetical protein
LSGASTGRHDGSAGASTPRTNGFRFASRKYELAIDLGAHALLLEQGRVDEAEAVYRADLGLGETLSRCCQHPENVWSLHGLHECLVRLGKRAEASLMKPRLDLALARTDLPINSSCFCRLGHAADALRQGVAAKLRHPGRR